MRFRIFIILAYFSLFSSFAIGEEGGDKPNEFRIDFTDTIHIIPELKLDNYELTSFDYTQEDDYSVILNINFTY